MKSQSPTRCAGRLPRPMPRNIWDWQSRSPPEAQTAHLAAARRIRSTPHVGARPRVYYRNLWRYSKCFIGGSVAEERQGIIEFVEGASVQLVKDGVSLAVTTTDDFGDFKFDRLDEDSGTYSVQIFSGGRSKILQI